MKVAPFAHIGGAVIADHGPISLLRARALAAFYAVEARRETGEHWTALCRRRAIALEAAAAEAFQWRLAAGWADPFAADRS